MGWDGSTCIMRYDCMISMDDIELLLNSILLTHEMSGVYIQCCIFLYISNALAMPSLIGKHGKHGNMANITTPNTSKLNIPT